MVNVIFFTFFTLLTQISVNIPARLALILQVAVSIDRLWLAQEMSAFMSEEQMTGPTLQGFQLSPCQRMESCCSSFSWCWSDAMNLTSFAELMTSRRRSKNWHTLGLIKLWHKLCYNCLTTDHLVSQWVRRRWQATGELTSELVNGLVWGL